jgi:hypothetical protein
VHVVVEEKNIEGVAEGWWVTPVVMITMEAARAGDGSNSDGRENYGHIHGGRFWVAPVGGSFLKLLFKFLSV